MRKRDLRVGEEYVVSLTGRPVHARLVELDHNWSSHYMEITNHGFGSHYADGTFVYVHSRAIRHGLNFVIHEEP